MKSTIFYITNDNKVIMSIFKTCLKFKISFEFLNGNEFYFSFVNKREFEFVQSKLGTEIINLKNIV